MTVSNQARASSSLKYSGNWGISAFVRWSPFLLWSEGTLPLKGEIAFTLWSDAFRRPLLYTCLNGKQAKNASHVEIIGISLHISLLIPVQMTSYRALSCRYGESSSG